uniref:Uncharacterized protein n=1 Tax=Anguilla anguilla TaxID=7936 RepID=A0A0E9U121_ANGAN
MMFQTVHFGEPKVLPMSLTVFFLFLSLVMASLTFNSTTLVLMLTNTNKRQQSKA